MASEAISDSCWYHGLPGQWGAMIVAEAPLDRSFNTRSSSNSQGGLHQLCSTLQALSDNRRESTASVHGSSHLEL